MLDIDNLEKRWLQYKIKLYLLPVLSVILLSATLFYLLNTTQEKQNIKTKKDITQTDISSNLNKYKKIKKDVDILNNKDEKSIKTKEVNPRKLLPSMNFLKNFSTKKEVYKVTKPIVKKVQKTAKEIQEDKKFSKIAIQIMRQNTQNDIKNILIRFKKEKNPALSLFLAKKYYELKNYKKSLEYALITNNINKNIEDSWLVFSRSLVKLGKRKKAIKVLQKYIENSQSPNAKILLRDIRSGDFK